MKYVTKNVSTELAKVTLLNLETFDTKTRIYEMRGTKTVEKADKDAPKGWTAVECKPYKVTSFVAWELGKFMSESDNVADREELVKWCNAHSISMNGLVTRTISTDRIIALYINLATKERGEEDVTGRIKGKPSKDKINEVLCAPKKCYAFRTEPVNRLYFMHESRFYNGGEKHADREAFKEAHRDAEAE